MAERNIETLEGGKHIRIRVGNYLDSEAAVALRLALREVWVNSCDELTHQGKIGGKVNIVIDNAERLYTVEDNGRGIPADKLKDAVLVLNTGSNFKNRTNNLAGANGQGLKAVAHTCRHMEIHTNDTFMVVEDVGECGDCISFEKTQKYPGTKVTFTPLQSIYGDCIIDYDALYAEIDEAAKFYPNIVFTLNGKKIQYPKGLRLPQTDAFYESDNVCVSLACQEGEIKPFGNRLYLPDGGDFMTHFKTQLTRGINKVASLKLTGNQIQAALSGYVAIYVDTPNFTAQKKSAISNRECNPEISRAIEGIIAQLQKSPKWQQVIRRLETEQKAEEAAKRAREKFLKTQSDFKARPKVSAKKLTECSSKDRSKCELFICEGDSAAGTIKNARMDAATQAIFGLRGKILNVYKASFERIIANEELMMLVKALGGDLTENGIIEPTKAKRRYSRIIFMNDHDEDGWAIEALLLAFFFKFFPKMVADGCLYRIAPSLFTLTKGNEYKFYANQEEAMKAAKALPGKWELERHKGWGSMEPIVFSQAATNIKTRKLIQITLGNPVQAAKAIELMDIDVAARKELIVGKFDIGEEDDNGSSDEE